MGFSTTGSAGGSAAAAFEDHNSSPVSSPFSFTTNSISDLICFDNTSATPPPPLSSSGSLRGVPKFKSTPPPSLPISSPSSHFFSIPAGLSPTELLDSPVLLSSSTLLASPTTGALRAKLPNLCTTAATNCNTNNSYQETEAAASLKSEEDKSSSEFTFQSSHPSSFSNQFLSSENALKVVTDDVGGRQDEFPQRKMMMPAFEDQKKQSSNEEDSNCITTHYPNYYPQQQQTNQQTQYQQQQHHHPSNNNNFQSDVTMNHPVTTTSLDPADEYNWRKYGQKQVKGSENPRSYYKCTHPGCPTKKKVERSMFDGKITEIVIKGDHSHPKPAKTRRSLSTSSFSLATVTTELPPPGVIIRTTPIRCHGYGGGGGNDNMVMDVHQENSFGSTGQMDVSSLSAAIVAVGTPDTSSISVVDDEIDRGSSRSRSAGENNFIEDDDDEDEDETEAKRWKGGDGESSEIISSGPTTTGNRIEREARVVVQTISDIDILDDGYRWRKYGQKVVKGNPNPRSYYKCTYPGCSVRKHVERAAHDIRAVLTTYEGKHFHEVPAARGSSNNIRTSHQLQCPLPQQSHLDYHHNYPNNNNNNMISNLMMAASAIRSSVPLNYNHHQTTTTSALMQQYNMNNLNPVSSESRHEQSASAFLQDMMFHHQGSSIGGGGGFGFSSGSGELNIMGGGGGGGMASSSLSSTAYYMNGNGNQSQQKNQH